MIAPGILIVSVLLYVAAITYALTQGPGTFLAGLLGGCGSIAMGVWLGVLVAHAHDKDREEENP